MPKNIVICCDGTGNEYGKNPTNVIKLYSTLVHDPAQQIAFYDPGVGTFSIKPWVTKPGLGFQKALGLAFGVGLRQNVREAYSFLINNFEDGDRVFIFGFSRGAYTARVIASLIRGVGILRPGCENLIPYALRYIEGSAGGINWERLNGFKKRFQRGLKPAKVFVGVWDTVSSVSWAWDRLYFLFTARNEAVDVIRHAVSIDERRAFFRTNLWGDPFKVQDFKQVWFPGVHCDVGGGNPPEKSGLSQLALEWMLCEARENGLQIDDELAAKALEQGSSPTPLAPINPSLRKMWWLCEIVPRLAYSRGKRRIRINWARRRHVPEEVTVHESVEIRKKELGYRPGNLPDEYSVEPMVKFTSP